jgi:hypothetical protein
MILFLSSLACTLLIPRQTVPGSLEEAVAEGDILFTGTANVTDALDCMDPSATVRLYIGPKTRQINGVEFRSDVNPVSISVVTNGHFVILNEECQKTSTKDKYDYPAEGIYYPNEGVIRFLTCTMNNFTASGQGALVGDGFEGQYSCSDETGVFYSVAFSTYTISE